jgi:3-methyladenine DNA glycosylase/8-oxoguanine DNA glycosylase
MKADATRRWRLPEKYDFFETTRLLRTGRSDPTVRRETDGLWRSTHLPAGAATVHLQLRQDDHIEARAWGDGADCALDSVPAWLGLHQPAFQLPDHPVTNRLLRENGGVRLNDTGNVYEALVNVVLQQLITWNEAACNWRRLVEVLGEPAPGPGNLRLMPTPRTLRRVDIDRLVGLGINRLQARTLKEIAHSASGLQRAAALPTDAAARLLQQVRGVGPWTAASVLGFRLGRPQPVVLGDANLANTLCWALAGEPRGNDRDMLRLLEPFGDQAFLVIRLIHAARIVAPRRAARRRILFGRY